MNRTLIFLAALLALCGAAHAEQLNAQLYNKLKQFDREATAAARQKGLAPPVVAYDSKPDPENVGIAVPAMTVDDSGRVRWSILVDAKFLSDMGDVQMTGYGMFLACLKSEGYYDQNPGNPPMDYRAAERCTYFSLGPGTFARFIHVDSQTNPGFAEYKNLTEPQIQQHFWLKYGDPLNKT